MKVSPLQSQRSENAGQRFRAPPPLASAFTASAPRRRGVRIGVVCIEALLDGASSQRQHLPADSRLQCLQIEFGDTLPPQESLAVPQDFSGEQAVERSFF
jgi:hypothetical protein